MKTKQWLALAAAVLITSAGCGKREDEIPPAGGQQGAGESVSSGAASVRTAEDDAVRKSLEYIEQLRAGQYGPFYENVTPDFARDVPEEDLRATLEYAGTQAGEFLELTGTETSGEQGAVLVTVTEKHALQGLIWSFAYDPEGRVSGFYIRLIYLPESGDLFEELPIQVGAGPQKMDGVLTLPRGARDGQKPPVAVLIHGSGQSDLNETVGAAGNRPFADIAQGLAARGVASIRYNKRYFQYAPPSSPITIEDEVTDDARAAVLLAAADGRVDGNNVYLLGLSLGGMLAPRIARDTPQIKGFISMAGTLRQLQQLLLDQNRAFVEQDAAAGEEQKAALAQVEAEIAKIESIGPDDTHTVMGQPAAYWYSLNSVDSAAIVRELEIPMLILQGENDFQVYADVDYPLWQETLAGKDNATFRLYPGLGHLFTPATDRKLDVTVYDAPAVVDPQVIADIADWIHQCSARADG